MNQELAGAGSGQPHEVFDLQIVIEFGLLVSREWAGLLPLDEIPAPELDLGEISDLEGTLELLRETGAL